MHLNAFATSGLLLGLTCLGLTIVFSVFGKQKLHKIYSLFCLSVAVWGFGSFFIGITSNPKVAAIVLKVAYSGVIFIPVFHIHTTLVLCGESNKALLLFGYLQGLIFLILNLAEKLSYDLKFIFNSFYYYQFTFLGSIQFLVWITLVFISHYLLIRFYIKSVKEDRRKILYFISAAIIGFGAGVTNFLPGFNVEFYPFGNFIITLYCIIITYAIFKYQLMDLEFVVSKGLLYSILVTLITLTYLLFVVISEKFLQGLVGYQSFFVSLSSAVIIAVLFIPLRNKIQFFIDRFFLGKTPEQIVQENKLLKQELLRSERLKAIATFASGMAHEIKNPLTAIKTFAEYLPQKINDSEFLQKFSKIVSGEAGKIDNLVHQLLDFSKPASLQLKDTDIHKLIDETLELLSNELMRYKISVKKDYYNNKELITKVDPQQIKQVFLNLFLNAIEAMPNGGEIFIQTNQQANQQTNKLTISIQDTGCGISEKDLAHIFEPFYSTKEKGSGLGLSIVYNIIKEHNGRIAVESILTKGTRFIIELLRA